MRPCAGSFLAMVLALAAACGSGGAVAGDPGRTDVPPALEVVFPDSAPADTGAAQDPGPGEPTGDDSGGPDDDGAAPDLPADVPADDTDAPHDAADDAVADVPADTADASTPDILPDEGPDAPANPDAAGDVAPDAPPPADPGIDPGTCKPDCAGRVCGYDGCFGECGTCPVGRCEGLVWHPASTCTVLGTCAEGVPFDCDDDNACTVDACDPAANGGSGGCRHQTIPPTSEGPAGDPSCSDGLDNDCDGSVDVADLHCRLTVTSVAPSEHPLAGGWTATLTGNGFDAPLSLVRICGKLATDLKVVDGHHATVAVPAADVPGTCTVAVTADGITASLAAAVRYIGRDTTTWGNTYWPESLAPVAVGATTDQLYGRVWADGVTNADPKDGSKVLAYVGYGPAAADPYADPGWTWTKAAYNPACYQCGQNYEYFASLKPDTAGAFVVAFRFSIDQGQTFQYGDRTIGGSDGSVDGFSASTALGLTVKSN